LLNNFRQLKRSRRRASFTGTKFGGGGKARAGKNSFPPTPFLFARPSGNYQNSASGFSLKKVRILFKTDSTSSPPNRRLISAFGYIEKKKSLILSSSSLRLSESKTWRSRRALSMFYTYILECADGSFYVGCTNNLKKRLKQHNDSKWGAHYTKIRRPVILKYSEEFKVLIEARKREAEIKGWRKEKKLNLIKFGKPIF